MEEQNLIKKIKSPYILKNIFNYIKDNNFKLKLFIHSKLFQNKLDLTIIYKEKYLNKIGFDINEYLHKKYEEDNLIKKYNNFVLEKKLNKKEFEKIISELIKNKKFYDNEKDSEKLIDMESPLLEIISKTKILKINMQYIFIKKI